jgi:hypothetical protein
MRAATTLFDDVAEFGGDTFDDDRDGNRLRAQFRRVWCVMRGGAWLTLAQIAAATGDPESSVSARLRDFRKPRYGGHTVERAYVRKGLWTYRVVPTGEGRP